MGQRKVKLKMYDPNWEGLFDEEAIQLRSLFGDQVLRVYHVGSTAIPGILAAPVIDVIVEVRDISKIDYYNQAMRKHGYTSLGENGIPGRRFFVKGPLEEPSHYIYVYEKGDTEIGKMMDFRDYLKTHPSDARAFSIHKSKLAETYPDDFSAYEVHKVDFFYDMMKKIDIWKTNIMKDLF